MTERPSATRSWPAASMALRSERRMPSTHSATSTSRAVNSQSGFGTRKSPSSRVFSPNSDSAAASSLRSISMATERISVSTTSTKRRRLASALQPSASSAPRRMALRSRANRSRTPGRSTLTATLRPSCVSAGCTCAIEAAATGGSKAWNASETGRPSACATIRSASACGKGGIRSCSEERSFATFMPTRSGRVARNWPNFTWLGPSRVSAAASRLAEEPASLRSISRASLSPARAGAGSASGSTSASAPSRAMTKPTWASRRRLESVEIT